MKEMRKPDEINLKNIKDKVKSNHYRNHELKFQLEREKSLQNLSEVEKEIDKTFLGLDNNINKLEKEKKII